MERSDRMTYTSEMITFRNAKSRRKLWIECEDANEMVLLRKRRVKKITIKMDQASCLPVKQQKRNIV